MEIENNNKLEQLMQADINMREAIADLESKIKDIKEKRAQVQNALNDACEKLKVTSIKTEAGTLTRSLKTRYWTSDWPNMYSFLKENNALELMEKRLCQGNVKEFLSQNPDLVPPGLQTTSEYTVVIRKNRNKEKSE